MKRFLSNLLANPGVDGLLSRFSVSLKQLDAHGEGILRVLTYHRVDFQENRPWLYPGLISATPDIFEKQMDLLAKNYHLVSGEELASAVSGDAPRRLAPNSVMVTFDDAYLDFYENAWPIMKSLGIPAVLFVPTGYPDKPENTFWWDTLYDALISAPPGSEIDLPNGKYSIEDSKELLRLYKVIRDHFKTLPHQDALTFLGGLYDQLGFKVERPNPVMSWKQLAQVSREGVTLGAHTVNHPLLNRISAQVGRAEISGSIADFERELGIQPQLFAYPSGGVDEQSVDLVREEGIAAAFTTELGINRFEAFNPFKIKRINITRVTTPAMLPARLFSRFYRFKGEA